MQVAYLKSAPKRSQEGSQGGWTGKGKAKPGCNFRQHPSLSLPLGDLWSIN